MRALLALLLLFATAAKAELAISPLRQVIDEKRATATFLVSNPSRRIVDLRVTWIDLAAAETGYVQPSAEQRAKLSAAPYLVVRPAHFRLEPGAKRTVTVSLREGKKPPAGERRSHLLVSSAAVRTPLRKISGSIELDVGLGVSTPVLLRGGRGSASARIGHTRLLRTPEGLLELETSVVPDGTFSAYGRIEATLTPAAVGKTQTWRIGNVAAYLDAPLRRATVPLNVTRLPAGVLELRYVGEAEFDGVVFARRRFEISAAE
jgi:hypothetical protein